MDITNSKPKYKLIRLRDNLIKTSYDIKWVSFGDDNKFEMDFKNPEIGRCLLMSPFNIFYTWLTTPIIEYKHMEHYLYFRTHNSEYELYDIKK